MKTSIFTFLLVLLCQISRAQPGTLDPTFGENGIVNVLGSASDFRGMAMQNDGKIILGGGAIIGDSTLFALTRLNADGSIDDSFGENGTALTKFGKYPYITAVAIQPDGKIVAVGQTGILLDIAMVRYFPDGTVDSSFGINGIVTLNLENYDYATDVAIQPDGKIIVAGVTLESDEGGDQKLLLVRYMPDGSLDQSFGEGGIVQTYFQHQTVEISRLALQDDGKIVLAGNFFAVEYFLAFRYNTDGSVDKSFGKNGIASISVPYKYIVYEVNDIAVQPDGKLVLAGTCSPDGVKGNSHMSAVRFKSDGSVDNSFGEGGLVITDFTENNTEGKALLIDSSDNIVLIGGYGTSFNLSDFALARLQQDGSPDPDFGENGFVVTPLAMSSLDQIYNGLLQPDGKIVMNCSGRPSYVSRYIGGEGVLPVKYASVHAVQKGNSILLQWQTTEELNNQYFSVERSGNQSSAFAEIGKVSSKGEIGGYYSFLDASPLQDNNFYRLKQVDKDGKYSYSNVVALNYSVLPAISLTPNPAKDQVKISGMTSGKMNRITITNISGKKMVTKNTTAADYTISISDIPAGLYMIQVEANGVLTTLKLIKQ